MAVLYGLGIRCYFLLLRIAALFHPKAKLFVRGRKDLLKNIRYALIDERRGRIWMHCASLGEFEQGRPVLEALRRQHPNLAIVLTFFSPSGYEVRKNYEGADYVFYLPEDSRRNARLFVRTVQPRLALFVKYDLWYFLLRELARRDIPAVLLSALFRREQGFFKWYGAIQRRMLRYLEHIFVQDEVSLQWLQSIGIDAASVAGDTRFDRVVEAVAQPVALPQAADFAAEGRILVAGSTWKEDEIFLKEVLQQLPEDWKLILVPHEVHEAHLQAIGQLWPQQLIRWSQYEAGTGARVLLVDQVGLLLSLYRYGSVAWIGGGFGKDGVHNVLEAAVQGLPCAYGPVYHRFLEAVELIAAGGAIEAARADVLSDWISLWEYHPEEYEAIARAARNYVYSRSGATAVVLNYLLAKNWLMMS